MKNTEKKLAALREAIKLVAQDLIRSIALHRMYSRCANADDVIEALSDTEGAWGFDIVRNSLFFELVLTLNRIHDSGRRDNASIDNIMSLAADWRVREHLMNVAVEVYRKRGIAITPIRDRHLSAEERAQRSEYYRARAEQRRDEEAPREADKVAKWLDEAFELYEKLQQEAARRSLRKLRNWLFAHQSLGEKQHGAKYGDEKRLLDLTVPLFEKLALAVDGTDYGLPDRDELWEARADTFWQPIVAAGNGAIFDR